jgi:hypothetical protein
MFDKIASIIEWLQNLPNIPKGIISVVVVLIAAFVAVFLWSKPRPREAAKNPSVVESYDRVVRILTRLSIAADGRILVDSSPVLVPKLQHYYAPYIKIREYIDQHPGDIKGVYEAIWDNGRQGRVFIDETSTFESAVSSFFLEYDEAAKASKDKTYNIQRNQDQQH